MARLLGSGLARTVAVAVATILVLGVVYVAVPRPGALIAEPTPTPIHLAPAPGETPSPSASSLPDPTSSPSLSPTASPDGDAPVATLTNPDGPPASDYPPDGYPFFETAMALPTYGLLWLDANQRDVHLALTGDIDGAIEAIRDGVPRGVTVYFHIVAYSQAELCAFRDAIFTERDELMQRGIVVTSGGCGSRGGRVLIGMRPLTPEALAYMRERYGGPIDYEDGGLSVLGRVELPEPDHVRLVAVRSEAALGLLTCGRRPFPRAALDGPPADLDENGPELDGLRDSLRINTEIYGDLSNLDWILVEKDEYGATFIADRGDTWLEAPVLPGPRGWVPATVEYCSPRALTLAEGGAVDVYLDPDFPAPRPAATELHVLLHETGCTGARSPAGWLLPPVARYGGGAVTLAVHARHDARIATCPGNPSLAATIVLPEPLGDRTLKGISELASYP